MANEDRCRELPQPGQRQQRLRDQTEPSEPPCCLSAESIPTEDTSPQTADPKKREELGHRREEGQRAPTEGAQRPPAQGRGRGLQPGGGRRQRGRPTAREWPRTTVGNGQRVQSTRSAGRGLKRQALARRSRGRRRDDEREADAT
jgi:hypothetical protein